MFPACFFRQANHVKEQEERAGKSPALLLFVAVLILGVLFFVLPFNEMLTVTQEDTSKTLLALPIATGDWFEIKFIHSVNLSPVVDRYQWTGESIMLKSTVFLSYGAGIPILEDGIGTDFKHTQDGFEITGIDASREKISIMLQSVPDHTLIYSGSEIKLLEFADSGTIVTIQVRKISFFKAVSSRL